MAVRKICFSYKILLIMVGTFSTKINYDPLIKMTFKLFGRCLSVLQPFSVFKVYEKNSKIRLVLFRIG